MAKETVKFDCLDVSAIDALIERTKDLRDGIRGAKMLKFLEELGKEGIHYATARFNAAQYDGVNDVTVDMPLALVRYTDKGASVTLTATGQTVLFIEYGTGVYYGDDASVRAALLPGSDVLGRGEYSVKYGAGHGYDNGWYYYDRATGAKRYTHGNPSNGCMYQTQKYLESKIVDIAKEVFTW